jgi:hypothetical protein
MTRTRADRADALRRSRDGRGVLIAPERNEVARVTEEPFELPADVAGFSRRECPRCHAHFKLRASRRDARALALALVARVDHLNGEGEAPRGVVRHCPYCGARADPDAWWTLEQRRWLEQQARRLAGELRWRRLRAPLERLGDNPHPTYIPVLPAAAAADVPRLDLDDLVAVPLPCCGEEVKVSDAWIGPIRCHFCGLVHARDVRRDIGNELAFLRDWLLT